MILLYVLIAIGALLIIQGALHFLSYNVLKKRIIAKHVWDLNICCGKTDGGGINADVVNHADVPNYVEISDMYHLPFEDKQFKRVLCSHTIEHIDDPKRFFTELSRVGEEVTLITPPLWDVGAVLDFFEHKWVFLSFRKLHTTLPRFVSLAGSAFVQRRMGQQIRA